MFFNIASELNYRHLPSLGFSYELNDSATLNAAYGYVPRWESAGPYVLPGAGTIAGASVETESDTHIVTVGLNVTY